MPTHGLIHKPLLSVFLVLALAPVLAHIDNTDPALCQHRLLSAGVVPELPVVQVASAGVQVAVH